MINEIKQLAQENFEETVNIRRHLHANPELSFKEYETAKFIVHKLKEAGIEHKTGLADGNGIVAEIGEGSNVLALRADIDALPIQESNTVDYASGNAGIMHACGHDAHSASLLGTILILKKMESKIRGKVRFLFQPAEERFPGGASLMIRDGALQNPEVSAIYGQHVFPELLVGQIGYRAGESMASADELYITITGKGGHAAAPEKLIDPVIVVAQIISNLQTLISRNGNPRIPSVLSIGKVQSEGGSTNIIPDRIHLEGTFRTFDEEWRFNAHDIIKQRVQQIAAAYGAKADVEIKVGYPVLNNDVELTARSISWMRDYMGHDNVVQIPLRLGAEDFSYYSHKVPACFYRLGTASPNGDNHSGLHTPTFNIDEKALLHGTGLMAWLAMQYLDSAA